MRGYELNLLQQIDLDHLHPELRIWVRKILRNSHQAHSMQEWKIASGAILRSRANYYNYAKNIFEDVKEEK